MTPERRARHDLVATELVAVVLALRAGRPVVLAAGDEAGVPALPAGPLRSEHRTLQAGMRAWVAERTGRRLGHVEQLYTFADRERLGPHQRVISVSYLGLVGEAGDEPGWRGVYDLFPWEDRRDEAADGLVADLAARLAVWAEESPPLAALRRQRRATTFGLDGSPWRPDLCLQRHELLYEAGLVAESARVGAASPPDLGDVPMLHDHRRIAATGLARLRATIQYRPVIFELMPGEFTLGALQGAVEAVAGTRMHTQNFRRLVEQQELVEATGSTSRSTGGRPGRLYRFRRSVHAERGAVGTKLPAPRIG